MRVEQIEEIKSFEIDIVNGLVLVNGEYVEALQEIKVLYNRFPNSLSIRLKGADSSSASARIKTIEETFFDFQR